MFDGEEKKYVIASPLEGFLLKTGNPMPNTVITRVLKWNGNRGGKKEEFTTDQKGYFSMPAHEETLTLGMLDQFTASMKLTVNIDGADDLIWFSNKFRPEIYDETGGATSGLVCDTEFEEIAVPTSPTVILTRCRWDNMPTEQNLSEEE